MKKRKREKKKLFHVRYVLCIYEWMAASRCGGGVEKAERRKRFLIYANGNSFQWKEEKKKVFFISFYVAVVECSLTLILFFLFVANGIVPSHCIVAIEFMDFANRV